MKQKIEWYREVLELEPGSKIFFPLARMLAADGQPDEAVAVLRQGISRHSDHMEARFLLIELLFHSGDKQGVWDEVDTVSAMLGGYPGFWQAWGERLGASATTRDAGLAAAFLAAHMRRNALSWADIIAAGLKGLLADGDAAPASAPLAETAAAPASTPVPAAPVPAATGATGLPVVKVVAKAAASAPSAVAVAADPVAAMDVEDGERVSVLPADLPAPASDPALDLIVEDQGPDDEEEEPFSLRTRSMAEVLAEQGDIAGALEIYEELLAAASTGQEKTALSSRIAELAPRLESGPSGQAGQAAADDGARDAPPGKNRLSDMLEALAQRLEARSLQ